VEVLLISGSSPGRDSSRFYSVRNSFSTERGVDWFFGGDCPVEEFLTTALSNLKKEDLTKDLTLSLDTKNTSPGRETTS
jgi:hypothetical protein